MRVIGIDPGTHVTGYGIVERDGCHLKLVRHGVIDASTELTLPLRLRKIYLELKKIIKDETPDELAIETAFYNKNVQSTLKLGHARGVSILAGVLRELPITEYSPREIKKSVVGTGAASKQQVQYMVKAILGMKELPKPIDASDALAVALCHLHHAAAPRAKFRDWKSFIEANPEKVRRRK